MIRVPPRPTPLPSPTLFRSIRRDTQARIDEFDFSHAALGLYDYVYGELCDWYLELIKARLYDEGPDRSDLAATVQIRKSTRLNSSHANISYAVFCLKKKQTY